LIRCENQNNALYRGIEYLQDNCPCSNKKQYGTLFAIIKNALKHVKKFFKTSLTFNIHRSVHRNICNCSTTKRMQLLFQIIYYCKTLYTFRTVFLSIIRSSKLRIQQRYVSNSCCYQRWDGTPFHLIPDNSR